MEKYIGKKLDGRYEIQELIGIGGMANVYKAQDLVEDRTVAVKILREEFLSNEEFIRRFKNTLGVTPYTYLKQLKIRTATALRNEGMTLEEVAEKCGYSESAALLHAISGEKKLPKIK